MQKETITAKHRDRGNCQSSLVWNGEVDRLLWLVLGRDVVLTKFVFKWFWLREIVASLASYQVTILDDQSGQGGSQVEDNWCKWI